MSNVFTSSPLTDTICAVMRRSFVVLALLVGTLCSAQNVRLVAIRVKGTQEFSDAEVARASGLKLNQVIGPAEFKNAAARLAATGAFAQVGYQYGPLRDGMFVELQVEDAPEYLPVRFENFVWVSDTELSKFISERVPLFHGKLPPGGGVVEATTAALQEFLDKRGIAGHAAMRMHSPGPGARMDAMSFYADGLRLAVKDVKLVGLVSVPAEDANAATKSLLGLNYYREVIDNAVRFRLEPLFHRNGFLHAAFDPPVVTISGDPKDPEINLAVGVHQGTQYKFGKFAWKGNTVVAEPDLNKIIEKCQTGTIANLPLLMESVKLVNGLYSNRGYLESKVQLIPSYDDEQKIANYDLQIVEGRLFKIGNLQITGLDADTVGLLQKDWQAKIGDPYVPSYEIRFIRDRLLKIAALKGREAITSVTRNPDGTVDVKLEF